MDAILTLPNGAWVGLEVKLGYQQVDQAASTLLRQRDKMTKAGDPTPVAMIVLAGVIPVSDSTMSMRLILPRSSWFATTVKP